MHDLFLCIMWLHESEEHMQVHCDPRQFEAVIEQKLEAMTTEWVSIDQGVHLQATGCDAWAE